MKKLFLLFVLICVSNVKAFALDVVYPRTTMATISSTSTFFVGSTNPYLPLAINGQQVAVHKSGGFAHTVKLHTGKNIFTLEAGDEKLVYIIDRPMPKPRLQNKAVNLIEYPAPVTVLSVSDNVPLRKTPADTGINRIAHFQKNIPLSVDGEQGDFFRIALGRNAKAWIYKGDVQPAPEAYKPAVYEGYVQKDDSNFYVFEFNFDRKVPYVIEEVSNNLLKLTFYDIADKPDLTYALEFPLKQPLFGYSGSFESDKLVFKIRKFPKINRSHPLKNIKIAIDAGHGGSECGTIGCFGHFEKDINLLIAKYLEEELRARGVSVIMTRTGDTNLDLKERIIVANEKDAAILLSIHANSLPDNQDPNANRGTSIYYYYNQAKPLADAIINSMTTQLGIPNDKVRQGSLALVRNTGALSILIETAYMINPYDNELLIDRDFQKRTAKAIADGIAEYLLKAK